MSVKRSGLKTERLERLELIRRILTRRSNINVQMLINAAITHGNNWLAAKLQVLRDADDFSEEFDDLNRTE